MKVALFTNVFYPEHFVINSLVVDLSTKTEFQVYTGLPNYPKGEFFPGYSLKNGPYTETYQNAKIVRYPMLARGSNLKGLLLNYVSNFVMSILCLFRIKKPQVSFVFATSPIMVAVPAVLLKIFFKVPMVIWLQDLWPESLSAVGAFSEKSIIYRAVGKLVRWIYKHTDLILIQSPMFAENLQQYGFDLKKAIYVPNWAEPLPVVENDKNYPEWLADFKAKSNNKFTVTFAGNLGLAQSLETVVQAAKILKEYDDIQFLLVGDGREYERLCDESRELLNLKLVGNKPFEDMAATFDFSDALLVLMSKKSIFQKTMPGKLQQYLSAGKPIVCATGGIGNRVVIEARAGVVSPEEDAKALANNILILKELSEEQRMQMGDNGKNYCEKHFQRENIIEQIYQILKGIVVNEK